jgi:integrase
MTLSVRTVKSARYRGGQDIRWDDTGRDRVAGLGLRVFPNGVRSYVLKYRTQAGRSRLHTIGRADELTLKEARKKAGRLRTEIRDGADPQADRQKARASMTVAEFLDEYLERHAKRRRKSWREDARRLERVKGKLGKLALGDLTMADVARLHSAIGRTAPVEANRIVQLLTAALNKAIEWGHLPEGAANPAGRVKRYGEKSRERFLTRDELPAALRALNAVDHVYVRGALMLILLAGLRKSEALRLEWTHVDLENRLLRIPETKVGKGRSVPLTDAAVRLLEGLPREEGNPYTFPGRYASTHLSVSLLDRSWRDVREAADVPDVTVHDLRRSCGSHLAMSGVGLPIIGAILGHAAPQATAIYARLQPDSGREALDKYAGMIEKLAESR